MMKFLIILFFVIWICSCKTGYTEYSKMLVLDIDQDFAVPNKFNTSNKYFIQDSIKYFHISIKRPNSLYNEYLSLNCLEGFAFFTGLENYCQSVIKYKFYSSSFEAFDGMEATGLIDNMHNLWFHPPRSNQYKPLQFCPYPYVEFPLEIGGEWSWSLVIGQNWDYQGDFKKLNLKRIKNLCNYKVVSKEMDGDVEIYTIESECNSELGNTSSRLRFSLSKGILNILFIDLDGVSYDFTLVENWTFPLK